MKPADDPTATAPLVDAYDTVLFDLDGVLYRGSDTVPGAPEAVEEVRRRGLRVAFVTNNSSRTPGQVAAKLAGHGVDAPSGEVVTSAMATADLLGPADGRTAFVVGEDGIREALREAGFAVVGDDADRADVVCVGVDTAVTYARLRTAAVLVERGARLIATNTDASFPAPDGLWPGAGALLAAITTTIGRGPEAVAGKPHPPLLRAALDRIGGRRPLVVGDRLDTDIDGAAAVGWDSLMVLTGVSTEADLVGAPNLPTHLGADLGALFRPAIVVRPAGPKDVEPIVGLLREAKLRDTGVDDRLAETLVAARNAETVGTIAFEILTSDGATVAHLRSLAVAERSRGERTGPLLTAAGVRAAIARGASTVYAVTRTSEGFIERMGFERTGGLDSVPGAVRVTLGDAADEHTVGFRWPPRGSPSA
ncbi:MAG TPA: HAD-IIA family hydrolase [Actinomycetota bacterium]